MSDGYDVESIYQDVDSMLDVGPCSLRREVSPENCMYAPDGAHAFISVYEDDLAVCTNCGFVDNVPLQLVWAPFHNGYTVADCHVRRFTSAPYQAIYYWNEKCNQANATDPPRPQAVVDVVQKIGAYFTQNNNRILTEKIIRKILRFVGATKYGENWWQIYRRVNQIPHRSRRIPTYVLQFLHCFFGAYYVAATHHMMTKQVHISRLINYNYVAKRMLQHHDTLHGTRWWDKYGGWWKQLKSVHRLQEYATLWDMFMQHIQNTAALAAMVNTPRHPTHCHQK